MNVLLVHAHPEPKSFGAAMRDRGLQALVEAGHTVQVSDLYAMNFNPVATGDDFTQRRFADRLQYDREQKHAHQHQAFAPDIQAEIDKLLWSELLILQFPLWWFSVPAILKGWLDRVFVNGVAYGPGRRLETGGLRGRCAMLALTTGCFENMTAPDGLLGDLNVILWYLHFGTFAYAGLRVLPPFTAFAVQYATPDQQQSMLDAYAQRLTQLDQQQPLFFHPQSDFGADWRMRPEVQPATVAQRRPDR